MFSNGVVMEVVSSEKVSHCGFESRATHIAASRVQHTLWQHVIVRPEEGEGVSRERIMDFLTVDVFGVSYLAWI